MNHEPEQNEPEQQPAAKVTRRSFLGLAGTMGIGAATRRVPVGKKTSKPLPAAAATAPASSISASSAAPSTSPATSKVLTASPAGVPVTPGILVLVTLYGGNDGLNTLIPLDAGPYLSGRGALAYQGGEALGLGEGFGLHPAMTGLKSLWDSQRLAVVRGVGYPSPSRSHFRSQDIWSSAVPSSYERTGWIGRWYDKVSNDPLGLAAISSAAPRSFTGSTGNGVVIDTVNTKQGPDADVVAATAILNRADDSMGALAARVRATGNELGRVEQVFRPMLASQPPTPIQAATLESPNAARAGNALTDQLNIVARLIKSDAPTRVYAVSLGGFDTHANEKTNHANLMGILDRAISGFVQVMAADARGQRVTVAVTSEFGRRLAANGSGGTDHGTAAPVLIAGPSVKGGFYGDPPLLTDLDQGDLKFTTDFRRIYATLLSGVLGADPAMSLDARYLPLGFL